MSITGKFLDFIGITEPAEEEEKESGFMEEEEIPEEKPASKKTAREQRQGGERGTAPNVASQKMIVYHPVTYEDAQSIIDNLRGNKPVIVNMEDLDVAAAQRILDFLSGAIYALEGNVRKISRNIFVMAPASYDIVASETSDDEAFDM